MASARPAPAAVPCRCHVRYREQQRCRLLQRPYCGSILIAVSRTAALLALLALLAPIRTANAADLSGLVFRDKNGDGRQDPGEEGLDATIEVFGRSDAAGTLDINLVTAADGSFFLGPADIGDGCYVVRVQPPAGFRLGRARRDCPAPGLGHPVVGARRYASLPYLIDRLRGGSLLHISLGDSINEPASLCTLFPRDNTDYIGWLGERLACIAPTAMTDNEAIGGKETRHLLETAGTCEPPALPVPGDPGDRCDNVHDTIARTPDLVTVSIGGNDWLGSEPSQQSEPFPMSEVQVSVEALLDARRNAQEILAALATELPTTDVMVNTVYDNAAPSCASTDFHNIWIPMWNQMLRDLVWGQGASFSVVEVYPEYGHEDLNGADCCGEEDLICGDGVHPVHEGAEVHLEKAWDALGGVNLGMRDGIGATSNPDLLFPAEELVAMRPATEVASSTAGVIDPTAALIADDRGALVPTGDEIVLRAFDAVPAGIIPTHVVVAVRYRTTAAVASEPDGHFFDAATDGAFAVPAFTVTGWNTITPILGAGSNAPAPNAIPDVPEWREVRALLTRNLADDGRATGQYSFPVIDWIDVATLAVRLRVEARGAADGRQIEWDAAWVEVYGYVDPGGYTVFRDPVAPPVTPLATTSVSPFDEMPPVAPVLYYAVDDGAGQPAVIHMTREAMGSVRIRW